MPVSEWGNIGYRKHWKEVPEYVRRIGIETRDDRACRRSASLTGQR